MYHRYRPSYQGCSIQIPPAHLEPTVFTSTTRTTPLLLPAAILQQHRPNPSTEQKRTKAAATTTTAATATPATPTTLAHPYLNGRWAPGQARTQRTKARLKAVINRGIVQLWAPLPAPARAPAPVARACTRSRAIATATMPAIRDRGLVLFLEPEHRSAAGR